MEKGHVSIFTSEFWSSAANEYHNLVSLIFAGLTIAVAIVLGLLNIPVGINLHISVSFFVLMFGSMMFGPLVGLSAGMVYDIAGFLIFPSGVFFPGYTISSMLEFFIYGVFLYHSKISVLRIFLARFIVDFGIHVLLGSLWSKMLYGKGYYYFFIKGLIKNALLLPVEMIVLILMMQIFLPLLNAAGLKKSGN